MEKQFDHKKAQQQAREKWENELTYAGENNSGKLYSIDTPPPTVSGTLHIGHIFSYTQTDIIARYKRMQGYSVFYPFGFDDNGLPTERFVEKKKQVTAHALGRSEFIKLCLTETHETEEKFKNLWQEMGLSVDWRHCYSTISDPVRKISQESFIHLYKKNFVYRRQEPALYCTTCRTSVAQAELDSTQIASTFNDIVFTCQDGKELLVGTTRPEMLASCVALLYHPHDTRYQYLKGTKVTTPMGEKSVDVLEDELVDPEKGTGLVMVCTFGDSTDVTWYKKFKLPFIESIGKDGKMTAVTGPLEGLKVAAAREKIIDLLKEKNLLRDQKKIIHNVHVHERCKKEIEYTVLNQWFLNIIDHKQTFLELAEKINWYPAFMKDRYINWVEHINWDWCLSRQRFFGIPFPVWHCTTCNQTILAEIDQLPIDPQETRYEKPCPNCGNDKIIPDTDVMDTWNTSSLTPYICLSLYNKNIKSVFDVQRENGFMPMSMRPQAHDIIRTWAFYTIVKSWMHDNKIPWDNIIISGHVLSESQEKISKSKHHTMLSPENLLERYPADVIRYWTASGTLGHDTPFSENQMKIGMRLVTKLWNAFRFIHEHVQNIDLNRTQPEKFGTIHEWILDNTSSTFNTYKKYFDEENEFSLALDAIEKLFWHSFCDNYLEFIKDILFHPENYSTQEVSATRHTLYHVGLTILQMYAPYLPYVTEAIYQEIYKKNNNRSSMHQTRFEDIQKKYTFRESSQDMQIIIDIVTMIRRLKSEHQLSLKTPLNQLIINTKNISTQKIINREEILLKGIIHAQEIIFREEEPAQNELIKHNETSFNALIYL
ncbi:MAG TPA: valine--tRNA ligase [Candidatus Babeliales bacterium]|nr:valine--tRNA ligase [Candidatus Babeliales bacterium]